MVKILVSPGYGAGWSSWIGDGSSEQAKFALTYQPLIDYIEGGGTFPAYAGDMVEFGKDGNTPIFDKVEPEPLKQFAIEFYEKFDDVPYLGGARDLEVVEVSGPFRIDEYDGCESVTTTNDFISLD